MTYDEKRAEISNLDTWEADAAHAVEMIEPHLVYGGTVLDFGCGVGRIMKPLAKKHNRTQFIGVDIDEDALAYARAGARKNESYYIDGSINDVRSLYSVITFQHMSDEEVRDVIKWAHPALLRFQFAVGDIQMPYNYQRSPENVEAWCYEAGYKVEMSEDPIEPTWRWVTAK